MKDVIASLILVSVWTSEVDIISESNEIPGLGMKCCGRHLVLYINLMPATPHLRETYMRQEAENISGIPMIYWCRLCGGGMNIEK